jgi:hypothetical protein
MMGAHGRAKLLTLWPGSEKEEEEEGLKSHFDSAQWLEVFPLGPPSGKYSQRSPFETSWGRRFNTWSLGDILAVSYGIKLDGFF